MSLAGRGSGSDLLPSGTSEAGSVHTASSGQPRGGPVGYGKGTSAPADKLHCERHHENVARVVRDLAVASLRVRLLRDGIFLLHWLLRLSEECLPIFLREGEL